MRTELKIELLNAVGITGCGEGCHVVAMLARSLNERQVRLLSGLALHQAQVAETTIHNILVRSKIEDVVDEGVALGIPPTLTLMALAFGPPGGPDFD